MVDLSHLGTPFLAAHGRMGDNLHLLVRPIGCHEGLQKPWETLHPLQFGNLREIKRDRGTGPAWQLMLRQWNAKDLD